MQLIKTDAGAETDIERTARGQLQLHSETVESGKWRNPSTYGQDAIRYSVQKRDSAVKRFAAFGCLYLLHTSLRFQETSLSGGTAMYRRQEPLNTYTETRSY